MIELIKRDDLVNRVGIDETDQILITYKRLFLQTAMQGKYKYQLFSLLKEANFEHDYLSVYYNEIVSNISRLLVEKGFKIDKEDDRLWVYWDKVGEPKNYHKCIWDKIYEGDAIVYKTLADSVNNDTLTKINELIQKDQLLKNYKININIPDIKVNDTIIQAIKIAGYNISDDLTTLLL